MEDELIEDAVRDGTTAVHLRGLMCYKAHGEAMAMARCLPASPDQLAHFAVWCVLWRDRALDAATVRTYMAGISIWHQQAMQVMGGGLSNPRQSARVVQVLKALDKLHKRESTAKIPFTADMFVQILYLGFQQDTLGVRHNELLFVLLAAGPFRPNAAVNICVRYEVVFEGGAHRVKWLDGSDIWVEHRTTEPGISVRLFKDKNVTRANQRVVAIPAEFFWAGFD